MAAIWSELTPNTVQSPTFDCAMYPIEDQQVLSIVGADSKKFMQGQFTCNLNEISANQFRLGACCNAKGRMVSSFNLLQLEDNHYLLGLDSSLSDITINHLKKYMVFFKAQMKVTDFVIAGIQGPQAANMLATVFSQVPSTDFAQTHENGHTLVKLPHEAGFQLWLDPSQAQGTLEAIVSKCTLSTNNLWNDNLIRHGIGHVSKNTSEAFIPQMINLSQNGGISFNKGCYTGQEIVARMQYLGKLKRHMYRLGFDASVALNAGDEVFVTGQNNSVGVVLNSVIEGTQQQALVVLEDKALPHLAEGKITVGSNQAIAKELLSLPYDAVSEQPE
ncbi:MAG: folate-binding protein YgfZ [Oceanicoccus sp.]|jgi:folate-binding protein YgfZ